MILRLNLSGELESVLAAQAAGAGLSPDEYALRILQQEVRAADTIHTGEDLVAYWEEAGFIGARREVQDSQAHARTLRQKAETRHRDATH